MSKNKIILLIGGSGFLGRNIAKKLLTSGHKLVILTRDKHYAQSVFSDFNQIDIIEIRLNETEKIDQILENYSFDIVIHMASDIVPGSTKKEFFEELLNIVWPTFELLHILSQKNIKIIYFSSAGTIYGSHYKPITESTALNPVSYYGFSKLLIDQCILHLSRVLGLRYVIVRPSNVYGKYGAINKQQGFIEVVTDKILRNETIEVWGSGKQTRDFIHVSDLCNAIEEIISRDINNEILNIAYGESYSLLQIIDIIGKVLCIKPSLVFHDKRKVDIEHMKFDISHVKSKLHYDPLGIHDGITLFVSNYVGHKRNDK